MQQLNNHQKWSDGRPRPSILSNRCKDGEVRNESENESARAESRKPKA